MEKCSNQKEIDLMSKALYGNGRAGLIETTAHISTKVGYIETQIDAMWQLILLLTVIPMWFADADLLTTILTTASYFFLRAGLFNPGLNKVRKLKITHLGSVWFDKLHKPLARWEQNTRFPALTFAYWFYFAVGVGLGFFRITY